MFNTDEIDHIGEIVRLVNEEEYFMFDDIIVANRAMVVDLDKQNGELLLVVDWGGNRTAKYQKDDPNIAFVSEREVASLYNDAKVVQEHWLFKPKRTHKIEYETSCFLCFHNHVCSHVMEKRCSNYSFGTSAEQGCNGCLHCHARFDPKETVPCFFCKDFEDKRPLLRMKFEAKHLQK